MNKYLISVLFVVFSAMISVSCFTQELPGKVLVEEIYVEGGNSQIGDGIQHKQFQAQIPDMLVAKYKITWKLFTEVFNNAIENNQIKITKRGVFVMPQFIPYFNQLLFDHRPKLVGVEIIDGKFSTKSGMENYPVNYIGWYGAALFCNFLSSMNGFKPCYDISDWSIIPATNGYRLPKDEEWEYFARGGKLTKNYTYGGSNDPLEVGWFIANSKGTIHEVGLLKPNELGLYDISGNLNEFCTEVVAPILTPNNNGDYKLITGNRIWRGGSFLQTPVSTYYYRQNVNNPDYYLPFEDVGFRVIRIKG